MEDDALLTGRGQYTDDLQLDLPGALSPSTARLVFLRSPYPHARIGSVDTTAALAMPGVLAVWTGAQLVSSTSPEALTSSALVANQVLQPSVARWHMSACAL
jgi:CO/xanthine dehydrogenase Mo-binding subunit